ncbi:P-loop containing nucleoside triphosphate hydrolase protein [Dipodascopsis tothii]|uniref:P-loop containing nucleoside triphosphate hydrolase protein n=1 Tax=Dipodascopsis tothii TaxID=44089 RepID=UPI0034CF8A1C
MATHAATVAFAPLQCALVNLPAAVASALVGSNVVPQDVVISLAWSAGRSKQSAYVGWTGFAAHGPTPTANPVQIDPAVAAAVGLPEGAAVTVAVHARPPLAHTIHLEPATASDWELVELHAEYLETSLVGQVRAVAEGQPLLVYLSRTTTATLAVSRIEPPLAPGQPFARLAPTAEVVVAPKVRKKAEPAPGPPPADRVPHALLRAVPAAAVVAGQAAADDAAGRLAVFVGRAAVAPAVGDDAHAFVSVLRPPALVPRPSADAPDAAAADDTATRPATRLCAAVVDVPGVPESHVGLSARLAAALGLDDPLGAIVRIEPAPKRLARPPRKLVVRPWTVSADDAGRVRLGGATDDAAAAAVKAALAAAGVFGSPITSNMPLPRLAGTAVPLGGLLTLPGVDGWIAPDASLPLELGEPLVSKDAGRPAARPSPDEVLVAVDGVVADARRALARRSGALVYGSKGAGKSAVCRQIVRGARQDLIYALEIDCAELADERVPALKAAIERWFMAAAWHAPSVVVLEGLDVLVPAEVEHADSSRARQLAELFVQTAGTYMRSREIALLATTVSKESMHARLITGHLFGCQAKLAPPDKAVRRQLLAEAVRRLGAVHSADLLEIAAETEGCLAGDLVVLAGRAQHEAVIRGAGAGALTHADFAAALRDFTPGSLRGVKLQKSSVSWADIGGLRAAKQLLLETLEWPTKYAPIFKNSPLRLRSGVLLYGFPGCGKTFLASAVAHECGLNFISVKGPEILNKYIGASEQSVRDLFERAQAAKPCVLFFDEFDAIAPKRGHDSTGVTDRVVNQMLTQMDGVEGLDGVYVLAATSRPDLIDSALLRPGRIDKSLICDMPSRDDRLDILHTLTRDKMRVAAAIDLAALADRTAGFSGADLQALVYNAHLEAIHTVVDRDDRPDAPAAPAPEYFSLGDDADDVADVLAALRPPSQPDRPAAMAVAEIVIQPEHMDASLRTTKPSISVSEQRRLRAIYREFLSERTGEMPSGTASSDIGGRTTLM